VAKPVDLANLDGIVKNEFFYPPGTVMADSGFQFIEERYVKG